MNDKQQILEKLIDIFNRWQELLTDLSEEQITQPLLPSTWTVKDIVAHLWAWQQASVARAEAALQGIEPRYPSWWEILGPDPNEDVDRTNAWLYDASKEKSWLDVYADWKAQFEHYLILTQQIPEKDLLEPGRYVWMGDYPLSASTIGSLDHHQEHFETLTAWLQDDGR
jgi:hypothetical protein